jgi:hypothetical protein
MAGTGHNEKGRNGHRHVTETPDVSHIKNIDVTHEASDVSVSAVLKFVLALTIFAVIVQVLIWGMFKVLNAQEEKKEPQRGPMAMTELERLPPAPRLQAAPGFGVKLENGEWVALEKREPQAEYRVLRQQWEQMLSLGLSDPAGKFVVMPIDQAMEKVLEGNGLPSRNRILSQEGPGRFVENPVVEMPTAESSGRMTQKVVP